MSIVVTQPSGGGSFDPASPGPIGGTTPGVVNATRVDIAQGTLTDVLAGLTLAATWNDAADTMQGMLVDITDTASGGGSLALDIRRNGSSVFTVRKDGWMVSTFGIGVNTFYSTGGGVAMNIGIVAGVNNSVGVVNALSIGNNNILLSAASANILQLGQDHATTPTAQRIQAHGVTTGTGASLELGGGAGSVAKGDVILDGGNRAALVADATDEASAITLVNALKAAAIAHGLMAAA
jgi:hypothetical protein